MRVYLVILLIIIGFRNSVGAQDLAEIESLMAQEKYQQAEKMLDKHLKSDYNRDDLIVFRRRCRLEMEKYQGAYDDFTIAISINSKSFEAYFHRGRLLVYGKEYVDALNDLNMAMRYVSTDSLRIETLLLRGTAKRYLGQSE